MALQEQHMELYASYRDFIGIWQLLLSLDYQHLRAVQIICFGDMPFKVKCRLPNMFALSIKVSVLLGSLYKCGVRRIALCTYTASLKQRAAVISEGFTMPSQRQELARTTELGDFHMNTDATSVQCTYSGLIRMEFH